MNLEEKFKSIDEEIKRCKHDADICRHGDICFEPDFEAAKVWDDLAGWLIDYKRLLALEERFRRYTMQDDMHLVTICQVKKVIKGEWL